MDSKIIAVDFDGTLCTNKWPKIGEPIQPTIDYIKKEQNNGAKLILWTNRTKEKLTEAVEWSKSQGIEFDTVNENLPQIIEAFGGDTRKIFANEYIDDRNNPCFTNWPDMGEVSDGYHTFNSLYDQRMVLFAALVNAYPDWAWKSRKHSDGEVPFGGGWFIVGICTPEGHYTYHYEDKDWDLFHCEEMETAPEWDGHTDKDVRRLLSLVPEPEEGTMSSWAASEVELAIKSEKEASAGTDDWKYGAGCYKSALRAYGSLCRDGHSGMSIQLTKSLLNRMIDGRPLTPIEDTPDMWNEVSDRDGVKDYQCRRMSSLFKKVDANGEVSYSDLNRVYGVNIDSPEATFTSGFLTRLIDKIFPITMPYLPSAKRYRVTCDECLVDPKNGDYDTVAYLDILTPDGQKVELNRYFKDEGDKMVRIDKAEFEERKARSVKKEETSK